MPTNMQERFKAVLKRRLQIEIQNQPPLFPWSDQFESCSIDEDVQELASQLQLKQNIQPSQISPLLVHLSTHGYLSLGAQVSKTSFWISLINLVPLIPEEAIADLGALYQQLKSEQSSIWFIQAIMLWNFLGLLWSFYIQINLENLWLPQNQGRKKIDD